MQQQPKFELLESLLWEPGSGYFLLDRHLARLERSADYFKFTLSLTAVRQALQELSLTLGSIARKVRLTLTCEGKLTLQAETLDNGILKIGAVVGIASGPIDSQNPFFLPQDNLPITLYNGFGIATRISGCFAVESKWIYDRINDRQYRDRHSSRLNYSSYKMRLIAGDVSRSTSRGGKTEGKVDSFGRFAQYPDSISD
ncbi:MAG: hypothetical protein HC849_06150 [Oscillatoriales cyanobacterium RU_3_3]|nr:hypothetical protein [Oscillatoriales cyanobacterium RU_3_3]